MQFENTVAFVTGANRGIGKAFVEALLYNGARKIYAAARNPESLAGLVAAGAGRVIAVALDVTDRQQIANAAKNTDVTLLINNAGVAGYNAFIAGETTDPARQEMETNYFAVLDMIRAFAPVLADNGGGAIINIASVASLVNFPVLGSYSASKAAVHSLTQGVRAELAGQGTHVLGVYPGPIDTDMAANVDMEKTAPSEVARAVLAGLEAGEDDIYPDPMAVDLHANLLANPKAVEKQVGEMLPG